MSAKFDFPEDEDISLIFPEANHESIGRVDNETATIASRRVAVMRLYCAGKSMRDIGEKVGCSATTVHFDVRHCLQSFGRLTEQTTRKMIARELARLDTIEKECWEAWEKSKGESSKTRTRKKQRGNANEFEAVNETTQRAGDPRYMKLILECIEKRARLLRLCDSGDTTDPNELPPVKLVAGIDPMELV